MSEWSEITANSELVLDGWRNTGSATGGWDGTFNKQMGNWGGLGGITWTSDDRRTSANITGTYSETSTRSREPWGMYSLVLQHRITSKTHLVLHHVHGYAGGVLLNGAQKNTEWYGINTHVYYDLLNDLTIGIRGEWFRDRDGFRVFLPFRVRQQPITTGVSFAGNFAGYQRTRRLLCGYPGHELEAGKKTED